MKKFLSIIAVGAALLLSSCMGEQNKAPSKGINLDSERVYGVRGQDPKQLANKYDDPSDMTLNRIEDIRTKLFPNPNKGKAVVAPAADSVAADTTVAN